MLLSSLEGMESLPVEKKKKILVHFFRRLINQDHLRFKWHKLFQDGIIGWPSKVRQVSVHQMNREEVNILWSHIGDLEIIKNGNVHRGDRPVQNVNHERAIKYHFLQLMKMQLGVDRNEVPWAWISKGDVEGWPEDVEIKSTKYLTQDKLNAVYDNLEKIKFSNSFIQKAKQILHDLQQLDLKISRISEFIRVSAMLYIGNRMMKTVWPLLTHKDLLNWPSDIPVKNPLFLSERDIDRIIPILHSIKFVYSDDFKSRLNKNK